jgi:predicted MFS family arabinose efflux permease
MLACNLARAAVLATIPVLATGGVLQLWHLFVAAVAMGVFSVFFDVAYLAYVPTLVRADQLLEANSRLEVTWSAGALAGPGLGGLLVQAIGAARAVLADAASFLVSTASLLAIRQREPRIAHPRRRQMLGEVGEGLAHVFGNRVLRAQLLCLTLAGVFAHAYEAPLFVFAYGRLHLSPGLLGAILASTGAGAMLGSVVAGRVIAALGVGRTMAFTDAVSIGLFAAIPLAVLVPPAALLFPLFVVSGVVGTAGNVAQMTLRQSLSPARLQGRMSSVFRSFFWGAWPLGNLLGGLLAATIGAATTLWLMALLGALASFTIFFTPLWHVHDFPEGAPVALGPPPAGRPGS